MSIIQEQKDLAEIRGIVVIIAVSSLVFLAALTAVDYYAERRRSKTLEERVNALESAQRCECDLCLGY